MNEFAVIFELWPVARAALFVVLVAHAAMVTIENARENFTTVKSFFRLSFSALSSINYNESKTLIMNI